jgi:S-adenosylmethionine:tRNA ribosyltransferase-isomerase
MSLLTRDYDYELPPELIARHPPARREDARMLVLHRDGARIEHRQFREFPGFIHEGDLVVLNDTKVIPARVFANGGRLELLLLEEVAPDTWKCFVKPGRRARAGAPVEAGGRTGTVQEILQEGERIIRFDGPLDLDRIGTMPLPPYIRRAAGPADRERYQTVFAAEPGAVAAPTAGLHFTPEILRAVPHTFITLHVGAGTFKPVQTEEITAHPMHTERFSITEAAAESINAAVRVIAVGTTTVRVLESLAAADAARGNLKAAGGETSIFIHPPSRFVLVDALLTNFHLPKSTLLMLVSAFAGREFILRAYAEAIRERYRFYSYGDCMLIL